MKSKQCWNPGFVRIGGIGVLALLELVVLGVRVARVIGFGVQELQLLRYCFQELVVLR